MIAPHPPLQGPDAKAPPAARGRLATILLRVPWRLIGVILLVVVLMNVDLDRMATQFARVGPLAIIEAAAAFLALLAARCWRWRLLTHAVGVEEPLLANVASCNRSIWLGLATPGRVGEFRRALDVSRRRNWSLAAGGGLVLFDLVLDFGLYIILALGGLAYFFVAPLVGIAIGSALLGVAGVGLAVGGRALGIIARASPIVLRAPGVAEILPALQQGLRGRTSLGVAAATLTSAAAFTTMMACLITPMGVGIGAPEILTTIGLASAAGAIPISYFGLGTREAALIWFLGERGVDESSALAVSFTYLLATLIGVGVSLVVDFAIGRRANEDR